jgi:hypothetical protein
VGLVGGSQQLLCCGAGGPDSSSAVVMPGAAGGMAVSKTNSLVVSQQQLCALLLGRAVANSSTAVALGRDPTASSAVVLGERFQQKLCCVAMRDPNGNSAAGS